MTEISKTQDFEATLAELEKIVSELEREQKLEQSLTLFERGMALSQDCQKFLKSAEQRVEILKRTAGGGIASEPFASEPDSAS
jgi:exodeoxyribonuclease VII small subunit